MFSAKQIQDSRKGGSKLSEGIHTGLDVTLERVDNYYVIKFSNGDKYQDKRVYDPDTKYPATPRNDETQEQANLRAAESKLEHLTELLRIFAPEEDVQSETYAGFVNKAISVLKPVLGTKKVNLKVILDSDGIYPEISNFAGYIEEYVEGQESKLQFSKWELENRMTKKNPVQNTNSPVVKQFSMFPPVA